MGKQLFIKIQRCHLIIGDQEVVAGRTKGEIMSKRRIIMRNCKLVRNTIEYVSFVLLLASSSLLLWDLDGDVPRTGQDSGLFVFLVSL